MKLKVVECGLNQTWNLFPWSLHCGCLWILPRNWDFYIKCSIKYETFSFFFNAEVVRTRLREEGTKYRSFFQTLSLLMQEEGYSSFYRGLATHLIRQIPNTAIMMTTYEVVVYLLNRQQHYYLTIGKWKTKRLQWTINILNDSSYTYIYHPGISPVYQLYRDWTKWENVDRQSFTLLLASCS